VSFRCCSLPQTTIHVSQIPARLDHVPDAVLQLLGLGEPAIGFAVPEDGFGDGGRG